MFPIQADIFVIKQLVNVQCPDLTPNLFNTYFIIICYCVGEFSEQKHLNLSIRVFARVSGWGKKKSDSVSVCVCTQVEWLTSIGNLIQKG